jgi:hypothetical protein
VKQAEERMTYEKEIVYQEEKEKYIKEKYNKIMEWRTKGNRGGRNENKTRRKERRAEKQQRLKKKKKCKEKRRKSRTRRRRIFVMTIFIFLSFVKGNLGSLTHRNGLPAETGIIGLCYIAWRYLKIQTTFTFTNI